MSRKQALADLVHMDAFATHSAAKWLNLQTALDPLPYQTQPLSSAHCMFKALSAFPRPLPPDFQMHPTPCPSCLNFTLCQNTNIVYQLIFWVFKREGELGWHRMCFCNPEHPFSVPHLPWGNTHLNSWCCRFWAMIFGKLKNRKRKLDEGICSLILSEAASEIPPWALSPINYLPKLEKINVLWQYTFPPASLGKGWRLACWKRATELHGERWCFTFRTIWNAFLWKLPPESTHVPSPAWRNLWKVLEQEDLPPCTGTLSSPATTVPYSSSPEPPTGYQKATTDSKLSPSC